MRALYTVKNFRVFDEEGAKIDIQPITILTGCNGSGKSSITKSLALLDSFFEQIRIAIKKGDEIQIDKYKLNFSQYPNNSLGNFGNVLHKGNVVGNDNVSHISDVITFEYTVETPLLESQATVNLSFKNGILHEAFAYLENDVTLFSYNDKKFALNFNYLRQFCFSLHRRIAPGYVHNPAFYKFVRHIFDIASEDYKDQFHSIKKFLKYYEHDEFFDSEIAQKTYNEEKYASLLSYFDDIPNHAVLWAEENNSFSDFWIFELFPEDTINRATLFLSSLGYGESILAPSQNMILQEYAKNESFGKDDYLNCESKVFRDNFNFDINLKNRERWEIRSQSLGEIYGAGISDDKFNTYDRIKLLLYSAQSNFFTAFDEEYVKKTDILEEIHNFSNDHLYKMWRAIEEYSRALILDLLSPDWSCTFNFKDNNNYKINRSYDLFSNSSFSCLLREFLEIADSQSQFFLDKWVKEFGIAHKIVINQDYEGLNRVYVTLFKNEHDDTGINLADDGHGMTQLLSIILHIGLSIKKKNGLFINYTITLEEPEIHLHPALQSKLADLFVEATNKYNIHFIIETHSEYLVRRLQVLVKNKQINSDDISLVYVENPDPEKRWLANQVTHIHIEPDGYLDEPFGKGFFDESSSLLLNLM